MFLNFYKILYMKNLSVLFMIVLFAIGCTGCGKKSEEQQRKISYELCTETMLPDELSTLISDKKENSFAFSYSTNEYTYIAVGYGMHDRDGYVIELKDIFATDYACYVECAFMTQEYMDSLGGVHIASEPSMSPYLVLRCSRLDVPVMFSCR